MELLNKIFSKSQLTNFFDFHRSISSHLEFQEYYIKLFFRFIYIHLINNYYIFVYRLSDERPWKLEWMIYFCKNFKYDKNILYIHKMIIFILHCVTCFFIILQKLIIHFDLVGLSNEGS